jgi:hypothetical protein
MAVLPLDIAPGHSANCAEVRILFVYMQSNTTSLVQPMNHRLIAASKAYSAERSWQW